MLPLWETENNGRGAPVTAGLVVACVAVFIGQLAHAVTGGAEGGARWTVRWALVPAELAARPEEGRQWARVFSAMFLHGGIGHLAGNGWFLWVFGRAVEQRLGGARLLMFYLVAGVVAAASQVAFSWGSTVPMLGASGAVAGVLGAYFVLRPRAWVVALVPWIVPLLPIPAVVFLGLWFVVQLWQGLGATAAGGEGGVAWWAHVGGFVAGVWLARGPRQVKGATNSRAGRGARPRR